MERGSWVEMGVQEKGEREGEGERGGEEKDRERRVKVRSPSLQVGFQTFRYQHRYRLQRSLEDCDCETLHRSLGEKVNTGGEGDFGGRGHSHVIK